MPALDSACILVERVFLFQLFIFSSESVFRPHTSSCPVPCPLSIVAIVPQVTIIPWYYKQWCTWLISRTPSTKFYNPTLTEHRKISEETLLLRCIIERGSRANFGSNETQDTT